MARIVIARDSDGPGEPIEVCFRKAGFEVEVAPVRKDLSAGDPEAEIVVIDATKDGRAGIALARRLRARSAAGILIIRAEGRDPDPVAALEGGADDVVTAPVPPREVLARVRSLLRRMDLNRGLRQERPGRRGIGFDGWILDLGHRHLVSTEGGEPVPLTGGEYDMLMVFLQNPCQVLSREHISLFAHGRPYSSRVRTLDAQVARLRKKLQARNPNVEYIKSVRSVGYVFSIRTRDVH